MGDIHAPSVASGPTTGGPLSNEFGTAKSSLMELIAEKDRVESELSALSSVLDSVSAGVYVSLLRHGSDTYIVAAAWRDYEHKLDDL